MQNNIASEISLIDWQMIRCVSPAMDLLYSLCTSTDKELRSVEYDNLFHEYYKELSLNLRKMGSDPDTIYPFAQLQNDLKLCGNFPLLIAPALLSVCLSSSDEAVDLNELSNQKETSLVKELNSENKNVFEKRITDLIEDFYELNYFRKLSFE